jgi:hypothetical protein
VEQKDNKMIKHFEDIYVHKTSAVFLNATILRARQFIARLVSSSPPKRSRFSKFYFSWS